MGNPIGLENVQSANPPQAGPPQEFIPSQTPPSAHVPQGYAGIGTAPKHATADSGQFIAPTIPPKPVNPYAPTGWRKKVSVEFDLQVPSGQLCRIRRLDRNDLFKLKIVDKLDTLLPMLLDMDGQTPEERSEKIKEKVKANPEIVDDMYNVQDLIVLACCVRPYVTNDQSLTDYDAEIPIVHIDDIDIEDRGMIFAYAFGRDADELKSVASEASIVQSVPTGQDFQLPTQPSS